MSMILAMDDIKPELIRRATGRGAPGGAHTDFFKATRDAPDGPSAYLVHNGPLRVSTAHFHEVDQFQIILEGGGTFGRHEVAPYNIHFARAHTPYGPLMAGKEAGWTFITLRTHYDPGAQRLSTEHDKLKQIANRQPWQVHQKVTFPAQRGPGISLEEVPEIKDDQGLFACSLSMGPNTHTGAPDPSRGNGQFVLVFKGSLVYQNKEHKALTVVFVKPEEKAFEVHAGPQGLEGLIVNFPQVKQRGVDSKAPSTAAGSKKWQCLLCSFAYDEALGMPQEGIPAGTRWENVPDTWNCPDCSASKSDFQMVEV